MYMHGVSFYIKYPFYKIQIKTQPRLPILCLIKLTLRRIDLTLIIVNLQKRLITESSLFLLFMYGPITMKHDSNTKIEKKNNSNLTETVHVLNT